MSEVYLLLFPSLILYCIKHFYCVILHVMSPVSFITSWITVFVNFTYTCLDGSMGKLAAPGITLTRFWVPGLGFTSMAGAPMPGPHPNMS
jgi:hypothetical protein